MESEVNRPTETAGKKFDEFYIYVPRGVSNDSCFPFKANQKVKVRIDVENRRLVIENAEK